MQVLPRKRTNLNKNSSFETNTTDWTGYNSGSVARVSTQAFSGTYSLEVQTPGGTVPEGTRQNGLQAATASRTYTASVWVRAPNGRAMRFEFLELTAASALVDTTTTTFTGTGDWQRVSATRAFGSTGVQVALRVGTHTSVGAITFHIDAVVIEEGGLATPYFDGSSPRAKWNGTAHASSSTRRTGSVRL